MVQPISSVNKETLAGLSQAADQAFGQKSQELAQQQVLINAQLEREKMQKSDEASMRAAQMQQDKMQMEKDKFEYEKGQNEVFRKERDDARALEQQRYDEQAAIQKEEKEYRRNKDKIQKDYENKLMQYNAIREKYQMQIAAAEREGNIEKAASLARLEQHEETLLEAKTNLTARKTAFGGDLETAGNHALALMLQEYANSSERFEKFKGGIAGIAEGYLGEGSGILEVIKNADLNTNEGRNSIQEFLINGIGSGVVRDLIDRGYADVVFELAGDEIWSSDPLKKEQSIINLQERVNAGFTAAFNDPGGTEYSNFINSLPDNTPYRTIIDQIVSGTLSEVAGFYGGMASEEIKNNLFPDTKDSTYVSDEASRFSRISTNIARRSPVGMFSTGNVEETRKALQVKLDSQALGIIMANPNLSEPGQLDAIIADLRDPSQFSTQTEQLLGGLYNTVANIIDFAPTEAARQRVTQAFEKAYGTATVGGESPFETTTRLRLAELLETKKDELIAMKEEDDAESAYEMTSQTVDARTSDRIAALEALLAQQPVPQR